MGESVKTGKSRVYCAGPLFNEKEREEMEEIAARLQDAGHATFLPHRDGLELTPCVQRLLEMGLSLDRASALMARAIFALDVYQVLKGCDIVVANLNGRVPDEGAVSEAAMAWSRGKIVVGYKADSRTAFHGQDNPLVLGLFAFNLCGTLEELVKEVEEALRSRQISDEARETREQEIQGHIELGAQIWQALQEGSRIEEIADVMMIHLPREVPS